MESGTININYGSIRPNNKELSTHTIKETNETLFENNITPVSSNYEVKHIEYEEKNSKLDDKKASELVENAKLSFNKIFDLFSEGKISDDVKENLITELYIHMKDDEGRINQQQFLEDFYKNYNIEDDKKEAIEKVVNKFNPAFQIGYYIEAYAILSGLDSKYMTAENLRILGGIVDSESEYQADVVAERFKQLNIKCPYSREDIIKILDCNRDSQNPSFEIFKEIGYDVLKNSANFQSQAEKHFGTILEKLSGDSISCEAAINLEKELNETLKNGDIQNIDEWLNNFAQKYNIQDENTKNALRKSLNIISTGKKLSMSDIAAATTSYALLYGTKSENVTGENIKNIINAIKNNKTIKEQTEAIEALKIDSDFNKKDTETILNKLNKNNDDQISKDELTETGINSLTKSIQTSQNILSGKYSGINGVLDEALEQGYNGNCWFIAGILALSATPQGKDIIKKAIVPNNDGSVTVNFEGVGKSYKITKEEIEKADKDNTYSQGDNDMLVLEIAMSKYKKEIGDEGTKFNSGNTSPEEINSNSVLHGGFSYEVFRLFGDYKVFETNSFCIGDTNPEIIDEILKSMNKNRNMAICFDLRNSNNVKLTDGTNFRFGSDHGNYHAFAVTDIGEDTVTFVNPWNSEKKYTMSIEEFKKLGIRNLECIEFNSPNGVESVLNLLRLKFYDFRNFIAKQLIKALS